MKGSNCLTCLLFKSKPKTHVTKMRNTCSTCWTFVRFYRFVHLSRTIQSCTHICISIALSACESIWPFNQLISHTANCSDIWCVWGFLTPGSSALKQRDCKRNLKPKLKVSSVPQPKVKPVLWFSIKTCTRALQAAK